MDEPSLKTPIHLRYWQRCLRTFLPHHYTPNDSQRMTLGFFIIVAIDLLTPSSASPSTSATATATATSPPDQQQQQQQQQQPPTKPILTPTDRRNLRQWVLACQHPDGGFCGSPTHVFPPHQHQDTMGMGNANIAATYFALLLLAMLAEDDDGGGAAEGTFAGVHRARTLRWLRRLQRSEDGSFGEVVYELPAVAGQHQAGGEEEGKGRMTTTIVGGGKDMRYCYLAATIRWILRGEGEDEEEDIDVDALLAHIRRSQTFDGGFSESFRHESHAGYAYCAVAALALLDRPDEEEPEGEKEEETAGPEAGAKAEQTPYYKRSQALQDGISDIPGFISFLVSRQFAYLDPETADGGAEGDNDDNDDCANFQLASLSLADPDEPPRHVGFNGRCNKVADTCYTWWVLGSLSVLGVLGNGHDGHDGPAPDNSVNRNNTVDPAALRAQRDFLLDKTQHAVGGFGKRPGDPPDIYHSSLGLAALATMGYPGLKRFDSGLCVSADTVRKIEKGRRALLGRARKEPVSSGGGAGARVTRVDLGKSLMDMALSMRGGESPAWLEV
jgi:geranylgeranyl transferase type-1 subunit beta